MGTSASGGRGLNDTVQIALDSPLHVFGLDGMALRRGPSTMIQRVDNSRNEVAVGFLIHTCATSWSKVTIYSYATRPALRVDM